MEEKTVTLEEIKKWMKEVVARYNSTAASTWDYYISEWAEEFRNKFLGKRIE